MRSATASAIDEEQYRRLHLAAFAALFCVGLYAGTLGPVFPFLSEDLGVTLDTAGLIITSLFIGSVAASSIVATALHRHDTRLLATGGVAAALLGAGTLAIAPTWPVALAGAAVLGIGDGLMIASTHILMATTSRDVPRAINRLNVYFAVGAVCGPLWAGTVLATTGEWHFVFAGVVVALLATLAAMASSESPPRRLTDTGRGPRMPGNPTAWLMGVVLFLYVGAEFGLGSWVSSYVRESTDAGVFAAAALTSGYWAALMIGRFIATAYYRRRSGSAPLLMAAIIGAGVSSLLLALTTGDLVLSAIAAFGAGLALGPVWPATVSIASEGGGDANATAATITLGNAGGVVLPWLQGRVLVDAGPAEGVFVTAVLCGLMLLVLTGFLVRGPHASRRAN